MQSKTVLTKKIKTMRQNMIKSLSLFLLLAVMISGCKKWIDTDMNTNPNNPADVSLALLLPGTQAAIAYTQGGDMTRYSGVWMQHMSGVDRQMFASERYSVLDSDINNLWNTLYGQALMNLQVMITKAQADEAKHYEGVAKVMTAYAMMNIASVWGDVPYSNAWKGGEGVLSATYDSQEQVYAAVNTLLNEAIALFGEANPVGKPAPGAADLVYGGDIAKWTKAAKSLKVRAALHLAKKNGMGPVRDLINAGGLLEEGDDFNFVFGAASNEWNPIYQFDNDRGDLRVGKKIVDMMAATNDPRMAGYFRLHPDATDPNFVGSGPGEANVLASYVGPAYASPASPVHFMTYSEVKFIEAEAFFGTDNAKAAAAYNDGVKASLAMHGITADDWVAANAAETAGSISLAKIMDGKYVANFMSLETWTDWRRTGMPALALPSAAVLTETPRRYVYPTDENLYNTANVPAGQTPTSRVWWDQ